MQQRQDPADRGEVDARMLLPERGEMCGQLVEGCPVGHTDREVVETGGCSCTVGVQGQAEFRWAVGMHHRYPGAAIVLAELDDHLIAEPAGVPLDRPGQVADRSLRWWTPA